MNVVKNLEVQLLWYRQRHLFIFYLENYVKATVFLTRISKQNNKNRISYIFTSTIKTHLQTNLRYNIFTSWITNRMYVKNALNVYNWPPNDSNTTMTPHTSKSKNRIRLWVLDIFVTSFWWTVYIKLKMRIVLRALLTRVFMSRFDLCCFSWRFEILCFVFLRFYLRR